MGPLDFIGGLLSNAGQNFDDPKNQGLLTMGLKLMSPTQQRMSTLGRIGESGLLGVKAMNDAQVQERANRQNDIQQLNQAYTMLHSQEPMRMMQYEKQNGSLQGYQPEPALGQIGARLTALVSGGNMARKVAPAAPQDAPPAPQQPALPPQEASQYSPVVQPALRASGPMPQPQPPQQAPQGPGMFSAKPFGMDALQMYSQDPTGKSYNDAVIKSRTPIATKNGIYIQDPNNWQQVNMAGGMIPQGNLNVTIGADGKPAVGLLPGQAETQNTLERNKLMTAAPFDMKTVQGAGGGQVPMSLMKLMVNEGVWPGSQPTPMRGTSIPGSVAQIAQGGSPQPSMAPRPQGSPQVASLQVTQPSQNAPQGDPWATMPKRVIPQGIGQSSYDAAVSAQQAESYGKQAAEFGTRADDAQKRTANNNQALALVDSSDTGTLAAFQGKVKTALVSAGVPETAFEHGPANTTVLMKDLMNAAIIKAGSLYAGKGRMTQQEVQNQIKNGAANGDMVASAIKFLLNTDNVQAAYDVKQSNDFGKYISHQGDPTRFKGWYADAFPLTREEERVKMGDGAKSPGISLSPTQIRLSSGKVATFPSAQAVTAYKRQMGIQ